ncbi:hypothetical protein CJ030_MR5G023731 [Morella rubra]|uniref:Uncharacterized protein n=1 Tax=Morella rubra TaxID=262757 RepID=A0A6A1VGT1_9ROSI|nr:hypothetical protein CJ030_MR5G023731 [Morella rubra]
MEASIFLSGVAEGIIVSLGSPPVKEIVQLWGVEVEAEKLNDTVSTIKTVLLCVEEQQDGNHEVRVWLEKLKIPSDRKFHLEGHRVKIGIENKKRGDTFSFVLEEDVIGREEDKKAVIALLLDSNVEENVSILPILFPKDYVFKKSTLILLWMAQGFISVSHRHQELEDIGHDYFMDLLWRSFFQEAKVDEFGDVISCKMHGLMRDLAISVAGSLITTLDSIDEKTRHVSVDSFPVVTASFSTSTKIRTLIFPDEGPGVTESTCDAIFSSFQFLRALDLKDSELDFELSSIGIQYLSALQYLVFKDCDALDVSNDEDGMQWQGLKSLLTLEFSNLPKLVSLPSGLQYVTTLQKLSILSCDSFMAIPEWIDNCTSLVQLKILRLWRHGKTRRTEPKVPIGGKGSTIAEQKNVTEKNEEDLRRRR